MPTRQDSVENRDVVYTAMNDYQKLSIILSEIALLLFDATKLNRRSMTYEISYESRNRNSMIHCEDLAWSLDQWWWNVDSFVRFCFARSSRLLAINSIHLNVVEERRYINCACNWSVDVRVWTSQKGKMIDERWCLIC